jgi:hypothetical protein
VLLALQRKVQTASTSSVRPVHYHAAKLAIGARSRCYAVVMNEIMCMQNLKVLPLENANCRCSPSYLKQHCLVLEVGGTGLQVEGVGFVAWH